MNRIVCSIYKSPKKEEMYLYVPKLQGLKQVPGELLELFGKPAHVMDLMLTPERKLARENIETVMAKIEEQGFYLQLPPPKEESIEHTLAEALR
ncbi:MAG: YcgL domain-containing protein, partial [Deltaproteobacteria bacterium]|nr:YcgL domain-containing protein [Deltaproteobacteria bacterium]